MAELSAREAGVGGQGPETELGAVCVVEDGGEGEAGHGGPVPRLGVAPLTAVRSLLIDHQVAKVTNSQQLT